MDSNVKVWREGWSYLAWDVARDILAQAPTSEDAIAALDMIMKVLWDIAAALEDGDLVLDEMNHDQKTLAAMVLRRSLPTVP